MQVDDENMPLSIRRTRRSNWRLPKHFRDLLPEPPLPLPPQGAEVSLEVNITQTNLGSCPATIISSLTSSDQSEQLPSQRCAMIITKMNSFGLFCLYDKDSIPSTNDPEDQSGADSLPAPRSETSVSQPLPSSINPFYPYPNENSWRIGDWYWNKGTQKSKHSFKKLMG